jgi:pimeloyl-ACP methyl ester carboxylesterase
LKALGLQGNLPLARITRRRKRVFTNKQLAFKQFAAGKGIFKSWSEEFIAAYLECGLLKKDANTAILKCEPELEAQIFESIPLNIWSYAERVRCPVLAVKGEFSNAFVSKSARRLQSMIRDYEFTEIPHSGHFVPMEQPHACSRVIKTFLNRIKNK